MLPSTQRTLSPRISPPAPPPHGSTPRAMHQALAKTARRTHEPHACRAFERLFERGGSARRSSDDYHFGRHMGALGFQTLNKYGLVNADEWQTILTNDAYGMPRYVTVMYWVEVGPHPPGSHPLSCDLGVLWPVLV